MIGGKVWRWSATGLLGSWFLVSCGPSMADLQYASAGPTGCPPQEIAIANLQKSSAVYGSGAGSWTATCRGRVHQCSAVKNHVTCSPAQPQPAPPQPAP